MHIILIVVGVVAHLHLLVALFLAVLVAVLLLLHHLLLLLVVVLGASAAAFCVLLEEEGHRAGEQLKRYHVLVGVLSAGVQQFLKHFVSGEDAHAREQGLQRKQVHKLFPWLSSGLEGLSQIHELGLRKHLLDGDELGSELCSLSLGPLHSSLKNASGVLEFQFEDWREHISIGEEGLLLLLISLVILDFCVDSGLGLVINPLADEELVLVVIEVTALALSEVVDPVALEVISITLSEDSVAVALALVPLSLVDVLVSVDHATLSLGHAVNPVAVVPVPIFEEEGASSVLLIFVPVSSVLSTELARLVAPVGSLAMAFVPLPESFIFVSILVELNAETVLLVVLPVPNVPRRMLPLFTLDAPILLTLLLL
jgi:hypothetical protein